MKSNIIKHGQAGWYAIFSLQFPDLPFRTFNPCLLIRAKLDECLWSLSVPMIWFRWWIKFVYYDVKPILFTYVGPSKLSLRLSESKYISSFNLILMNDDDLQLNSILYIPIHVAYGFKFSFINSYWSFTVINVVYKYTGTNIHIS